MRRKTNAIAFKANLLFLAIGAFLIIAIISFLFQDPKLYANRENSRQESKETIEGLWAYESLIPKGGKESFLTGYIFFFDGYFLQQSISNGEPFEEQGGMAHAGPFHSIDKGYEMEAEIQISVAPKRTPPLSLRSGAKHQIFPQFSGDRLVLTFGSGTIQTFKRMKITGKSQVFKLDKGYLAFAGDHFLLVTGFENSTIAGSGTYSQKGASLSLNAERWFSVLENKVSNIKDKVIEATFDGKTLSIPGGLVFQVIR